MEWYKDATGIYYSEDNRFTIIKATDRIYSGDWELYDSYTKQNYYGQTLKHAKQIAEDLLKNNKEY
jgi:hypothetical protein